MWMSAEVLAGVIGSSKCVGQSCGLQEKASFVEGTIQLEGTVDDMMTRSGHWYWAKDRMHK